MEAEIERQLQDLSVEEAEDESGGEELGVTTEASQLIGHSELEVNRLWRMPSD